MYVFTYVRMTTLEAYQDSGNLAEQIIASKVHGIA